MTKFGYDYETEMSADNLNQSFIYFTIVFVCQYLPIGAQLACLQASIYGNWNELLQDELTPPDVSVSVNSHMFQDLVRDSDQDSNTFQLSHHKGSILRSQILRNFNTQGETIPQDLQESTILKSSMAQSSRMNSFLFGSQIVSPKDARAGSVPF